MRRLATALLCLALAAACDSDIPPEQEGLRVLGSVTYRGEPHPTFARPAIVVSLFTEFPPMSPPRGIIVVEGADLAAPVPFELVGVPAGKYKIVGQLIDLAVAATTGAPTGSYPNFCVLFSPVANIEVKTDEPTAGLDLSIYEPNGDPCLAR